MTDITYQKVIIGVDFDHHPAKLVEKAANLAPHNNGTIHLIHTLNFMPETYYDHYAITTAQLDNSISDLKDQSRKEAEEKLKKMQLAYSSLPIKIHLLEGSSVDTIIDFATENSADLIILGNYHKSGFIRLLGSTINGIMQQSPCDVLIVKT